MQTDSDLLLRINRGLSLIVGMLVIGAMGIVCCQYGPGAAACVHDFYHPPNLAQRQAENAKAMMRHVSNPKFEMNDEMRKMFEAREAEFEAARSIGESYRMPPPRRP
jgi:hypothetical protein